MQLGMEGNCRAPKRSTESAEAGRAADGGVAARWAAAWQVQVQVQMRGGKSLREKIRSYQRAKTLN